MHNPSSADLAAIEAEWPEIAAGVVLVELECRLADVSADALAQRAQRRAVRQLLALAASDPDLVSLVAPIHPNPAPGRDRSGAAREDVA